jgi:hypothetical protein
MRSGYRPPRQPTSSRAWKPSCAKHWPNRPFANALAELGALPASGGAKELGDFVRTETTKWAGVIKAAHIKLD